jgi:hypothetical protein
VAAVEEVEKRMGRRGLVVPLSDLTEADVVDDEKIGASPAAQTSLVGAIGEASIEVIEEIDAAGIADVEHPFAFAIAQLYAAAA